jgi:signal transduction histidine kinase
MTRMGIVAKLAFTSAVTLLALGLAMTWYSMTQLRGVLNEQLYLRLAAQSRNWIEANQGPLTYSDTQALEDSLDHFRTSEKLAYAILEEPSGRIIASARKPANLRPQSSDPVANVDTMNVHRMSADDQRYIEGRTAITGAGTDMNAGLHSMFSIAGGSNVRAVLRVGVDSRIAVTGLRRLLLRSIPLYGGLVVIAMIIQILMTRPVIAPVAAIAKAARVIAGGDLSVRVNQGSTFHNEVGELVGNFNDMTDRLEQHRREMQEFQSGLEEQVRKRTAELEVVNTRLREMDERKSHFLSMASHEVRTPLTAIKAFAEILLDSQIDDERTRSRFLRHIDSESERLSRLISNLLDLAKIESGESQWNLSPIDVYRAVQDTLTVLAPEASARGVRIEVTSSSNVKVRADLDAIRQVLNNLVSNAVKFSPEGGWVRIHWGSVTPSAASKAKYVRISVTDSGPGIPEADRSRIFDRFYRTPSAGGVKGTGLGLSITREIVLRHGGEIWVESDLGCGATLSFTLPESLAEEEAGDSRQALSEAEERYER